jgi:hypothetical protein
MSNKIIEVELENFSDIDEFDENETSCESCPMLEKCQENGFPQNKENCFLTLGEDTFYSSDDGKEEHSWGEMSYNKFK